MATQIPSTMPAVAIAVAGGPEVLRLEEREVSRPGPGQVLVKVSHAGINRPDILQREGRYPPPPGASDLPGLEIAGHIIALGDGVGEDLLNQRVCALVTGGGYAGYCLARHDHCLPVPDALSLAEGAAMPETLFTVWHNVFQRGFAREGETLLVHGGTSGIGTMAFKLAKLFGLSVIVTCGSDAKCEAALRIGADHAIDYKRQDFVAEVQAITQGGGVDITLDMVAGDYTQRNCDCLAVEGRLVTIAVLGGAKAELNMAKLMVKRQTLTGSTLRGRSDAFKALLAADIAENAWPFAEEGALRPEIDSIYPLGQAVEAHRRMESGEHMGKIVLDVASGV